MTTLIKYSICAAVIAACVAAAGHVAYAQDAGPSDAAVSAPVSQPDAGPSDAATSPETPPQGPDSAATDPVGTVGKIVAAVRAGNWRIAAAMSLSLLMFGFNWLRKNTDWLKGKLQSDRAGALSLLALAAVGGLTTALFGPGKLDGWQVLGAVWTAVEAAGLFVLLKKIFKPSDGDLEPTPGG